MDEMVIRYYRRLLKEDFPNSGAMDHPSIFVEAVGEKLINCGNTGNYMQLYLQVSEGRIIDIRYLCACEPVANVAVEVLCSLVKGKTLAEAAGLNEEPFFQNVGSRDEKLRGKVLGLLELLNDGITHHFTQDEARKCTVKDGDLQSSKITWDESLST